MFVCTANRCRSPMAKALYRARVADRGWRAEVASAGFLDEGAPVPPEVLKTMSARGVDLHDHRSRVLTKDLIHAADLVVTMTRQQLIDAVVLAGDGWRRCFTLVDAIRRATTIGELPEGLDPTVWVGRLDGQRERASLLTLEARDDIPDPIGGRPSAYERVADQLDRLVASLAETIYPETASA